MGERHQAIDNGEQDDERADAPGGAIGGCHQPPLRRRRSEHGGNQGTDGKHDDGRLRGGIEQPVDAVRQVLRLVDKDVQQDDRRNDGQCAQQDDAGRRGSATPERRLAVTAPAAQARNAEPRHQHQDKCEDDRPERNAERGLRR